MIRYYPDIDVQRRAMKQTQKRLAGPASKELATMTNQLLIQSGQLARTDGKFCPYRTVVNQNRNTTMTAAANLRPHGPKRACIQSLKRNTSLIPG